jgi:arsenate reductase
MKPNILVLCSGNSCRSQMAEGYLRNLAGDRFDVYSAGTEPKPEVHPIAVEVMGEDGIDISGRRPKGLQEFLGRLHIRHLIIVCSGADQSCPRIFPGMPERLYWPFDDPAQFDGSREETLAEFRRVRNEIKDRIVQWLK